MKKVLLFSAISLCISLTLNAQTITSAIPTSTSVELGADLTVTVTYTSTTDVTLVAIDLSRYDSNGDVVTDGYVATGSYSVSMPGTGTATATVNINIPGNTIPTSGFTNENYKIKATLHKVTTNGNWGTPLDTHIHPQNITLTGTATPVLLFVGDDTSWSFESLTWVADRRFTKTVMLTNGNKFNFYENNQWEGRHGYTYFTTPVHNDLEATGDDDNNFKFVGTTGNYTITVDLTAKTVDLESATTAGLEDINVNSLVMYPNPVSDILRIKNLSVSELKSFKIIDILGRVVIYQNNDKKVNQINVSNLSKGLYFLATNTNKQFKFLKK